MKINYLQYLEHRIERATYTMFSSQQQTLLKRFLGIIRTLTSTVEADIWSTSKTLQKKQTDTVEVGICSTSSEMFGFQKQHCHMAWRLITFSHNRHGLAQKYVIANVNALNNKNLKCFLSNVGANRAPTECKGVLGQQDLRMQFKNKRFCGGIRAS